MNDRLEREFTQIARRAGDEAGAVDCTLAEYIEGLNLMLEEIAANLDAAEQDLAANERDKVKDDDA